MTVYEPCVGLGLLLIQPPDWDTSAEGTPRTPVKSMKFCEVGSEVAVPFRRRHSTPVANDRGPAHSLNGSPLMLAVPSSCVITLSLSKLP